MIGPISFFTKLLRLWEEIPASPAPGDNYKNVMLKILDALAFILEISLSQTR